MINSQYNQNFLNISIDNHNVDQALLNAFIKILEAQLNIKFTQEQASELRDVVIKTCIYNQRDEIRYSDLWAMLESDIFASNEMQNNFKQALFSYMFSDELKKVDEIKDAKFSNAKKQSQDVVSPAQKQNLHDAIDLANKYMADLESNKNTVLLSPDIDNKLTGKQMKEFYLENLEHIQSMLRWHKLGCETVLK